MSSSSSSNSGSLRFRSDAASFSPGQYPNYIPQQFPPHQYMPPMHPQQPIYYQYPNYPIMVNQIYGGVYTHGYMQENFFLHNNNSSNNNNILWFHNINNHIWLIITNTSTSTNISISISISTILQKVLKIANHQK